MKKKILLSLLLVTIYSVHAQKIKRIRDPKSSSLYSNDTLAKPSEGYSKEEIISVTPKETYYEVKYVRYEENIPSQQIDKIPYKFKDNYGVLTRIPIAFSVITIPIKIRPNIQGRGQFASADIKNAGLFIGGLNYSLKKYYKDSTTKEYKWSYGFVIAPSVEKFDSLNTNYFLRKGQEKSQLTVSLGVTTAFTFHSITLAVVPIGFDIGVTSAGKHWVYNRRRWFGFGIGLDSKIIGF